MNIPSLRRTGSDGPVPSHPQPTPGRRRRSQPPVPAGQSGCCCCAPAQVRIVLPATENRPHETDLLMCGHHYRVSREALRAVQATVFDAQGRDITDGADPGACHPDAAPAEALLGEAAGLPAQSFETW